MHATCIDWRGQGVLLRGASGAGKSDLALRLIEAGAQLVADDQVILWQSGGSLYGRSPDTIQGRLEIRGLGIQTMAFKRFSRICLDVQLDALARPERLPEGEMTTIEGVMVTTLYFDGLEPSTALKVLAALERQS